VLANSIGARTDASNIAMCTAADMRNVPSRVVALATRTGWGKLKKSSNQERSLQVPELLKETLSLAISMSFWWFTKFTKSPSTIVRTTQRSLTAIARSLSE
jgi:hypothetical protein